MTRRITRRRVEDEFNYLLNRAYEDPAMPQPKCAGRASEFVDYVTPPARPDATELCKGCPFLDVYDDVCGRYGRETRQPWGIYGGVALVDGKPASKLWEDPESAEDLVA